MPQRNRNRQEYSFHRNESHPHRGSHIDERRDWYERDMMDERSGYRTESRPYNEEPRRDYESSRRNESADYSYEGLQFGDRDRERSNRSQRDRDYDTDRSLRGNTYESERWGAGGNDRESSRDYSTGYARDYNRDMPRDYTSSPSSTYGSGGYYGSSNEPNSRPQSSSGNWASTDTTGTRYSDRSSRPQSSYAGKGPKNFKRSDERIQEEVSEMLARHHDINAEDIEVNVKEGEVTLSGTVSERRMKHMAEDVAERCFGVKDVINNIRIKKDESLGLSSSEDTSRSTAERSGKKNPSSTTPNPSH